MLRWTERNDFCQSARWQFNLAGISNKINCGKRIEIVAHIYIRVLAVARTRAHALLVKIHRRPPPCHDSQHRMCIYLFVKNDPRAFALETKIDMPELLQSIPDRFMPFRCSKEDEKATPTCSK